MKRFLVTMLILMSMASLSKSQILISILFGDKLNSPNIEFGMDAGLSYFTLLNVDQSSYNRGLHLGFFFNIKMSERWSLNPSFYPLYTLGSKDFPVYPTTEPSLNTYLDDYDITRKLYYMSLPVVLRFKVHKFVSLGIGPQFSLLTKGEDSFYAQLDDDELSFKRNITPELNRFDVGFATGIYGKIREGIGLTYSIRYYRGFIGTSKNDADGKMLNQNFQFTVGIPVGAEKDAKPDD